MIQWKLSVACETWLLRGISMKTPFTYFSTTGRRASAFHFINRTFCARDSSTTSPFASEQNDANHRNEGGKDTNSVIYYGTLTPQIKGIKVFTCVSSFGGLTVQPLMAQSLITGNNFPLGLTLCMALGFFTFVTPVLIHLLTKKYVTEIRYLASTDTYTATTLSFFLQKINVHFKKEDVLIPDRLPLFTTMFIKGKPLFVIGDCFLVINHYIRMMGYDKPIDLKLTTCSDESHAQNKCMQLGKENEKQPKGSYCN